MEYSENQENVMNTTSRETVNKTELNFLATLG